MYANTGYMNLADSELEDRSVPLRINCCGVYRLHSSPSMYTLRPSGLPDYQLLYISAGTAWFTFSDGEVEVPAGNMVVYRPGMRQEYSYYLKDKTEAYWVHFTGYEAEMLLESAGFSGKNMIHAGISATYQELFLAMIKELQVTKSCYEEFLPLYFRQLILAIRRKREEGTGAKSEIRREMEHAVQYFNENLNRSIQIEDYAKKCHMSTCWFIRSFKQYVGMPPRQYLTVTRINRARELLESTGYSVGEIGLIVGYDNPLYFSRIFKKQTGRSPAEYRKMLR